MVCVCVGGGGGEGEGACMWGKGQLCTSVGVRYGKIKSGVGGVTGR